MREDELTTKLDERLVRAAQETFADALACAVVHGSSRTGRDFVPFWSDFDIHFYCTATGC